MARQQLVNGEPYLDHRTKINEMFGEAYRLKSNGRVVFLDSSASAADADGSETAPYQDLNTAVNAVNPSEGGSVLIYPGSYDFVAGTIDIPPNVSLINSHGRGHVLLTTSIVTENTTAQLERLTITIGFDMRIGDSAGVGLVETIVCSGCDFVGTGQYHGGDSGTDSFVFLDCVFGIAGEGFRTVRFTGAAHVIESPFIAQNIDLRFGSTTTYAAPLTFVKITNGVISANSISVQAYNSKPVSMIIFNTEFTTPITFDIEVGNTVNINIDLLSYNSAVNAGTNFNVVGLTINIVDLADYFFNDTIVNATITDDPAFQEVVTLTIPSGLQPGDYVLSWNMAYAHNDTNDFFTWQVVGNTTSPTFIRESKDTDEVHSESFRIPIALNQPSYTVTLGARVEVNGQTATILAANFILERKG